MRKTILITVSVLLSLSPAAVLASGPATCPPGLAKKNNGCLPPGQAKKIYQRGDHINGDFVFIHNPGQYGLDPDQAYYRFGDDVYRVNRYTKEVIDFIGAAAALLD